MNRRVKVNSLNPTAKLGSANDTKTKEGGLQRKKAQKRERQVWLVSIWVHILIVLFLLIMSVVLGLMFGYSIIVESEGLQILRWGTREELYEYILG
ncbi:hypothetical protein HNR44_002424 [Geomicrobium halophilum]|uniref:DNA-directed RNA polymerase subunit beta n=1 Tax=Geomicrobium halophilum TaxID=549000 RepID=A0A841PVR4_9BACL|nr:DNA-directed RNA polymerase subunit beta [Geomicrobium halophilum]MBB6450441.1 hypothetical protein [Geomicrobium halophilum]